MLGPSAIHWDRMLGITLLFLLAFSFQTILMSWFGWTISLALVVLVIGSFFLGFMELVFLALIAILVVSWKPAIGSDLIIFALMPFISFGARKIFSWDSWIANMVFIAILVPAFYIISVGGSSLLSNWFLVAGDLLGSLILGIFGFFALDYYYGPELD